MDKKKTLASLLKLRYPIVSAPMAYVAGGDLAGAVSKAGGFGLIGGAYGDLERSDQGADWIHNEFELAHKHFPDYSPENTSPVGIGFITWALAHHPHLLTAALTHKPKAVMLSFGDPTSFVAEIKAAGATLICQVQTVEEAKKVVSQGADIVVAQGGEAGGHGRNVRATLPLVPAVVDVVPPDVPVLAAGGIADGRGIAAALSLGASGVLIGTRFAVTKESVAHEKTKRKMMTTSGDDTFRTPLWDVLRGLPWPAQYNARTTRNPFSDKWNHRQGDMSSKELEEFKKAKEEYDFNVYTAWCGEGIDLIKEDDPIPPAGELLASLWKDTYLQAERLRNTLDSWEK